MNRFSRALAVALSLWMAGPALAAPPSASYPPGIQPGGPIDTNTTLGPGSSARTGANREVDRIGPSIKEFGTEATCNGTGDDTGAFQNAETYAAAKGGAFVYVAPNLKCRVSSTIVTSTDNVIFGNPLGGGTGHDVGGNGTGYANWTLQWIGPAGGTIAQVAPLAGANNQALTGSGFVGAGFLCNSSAAIGLQVQSVRNGRFENLYEQECTSSGYDIGAVNILGEAPDTQGNLFLNWNGRQISNAAPIVTLRGAQLVNASGTLTGGAANVSMDSFIGLRGQTKNGPGLLCLDADNVTFIQTTFYLASGGTGFGADLSGSASGNCRDNRFIGVSSPGGILARGGATETIGGAITVGDVVSLTFSGSALSTSPQTVSRTVAAGDTISTIGAALVAAINANSVLSAAGITAAANTQAFIVPISFAGQKGQTVTVASSVTGSGTTTESATTSPVDGMMIGSPTIQNFVIGPDATNGDPLPNITPGAQLFNLRSNGQVGGLAGILPVFADTAADAVAGAKLAQSLGGLSALVYNTQASGIGVTNGVSRCILGMANSGSLRINRSVNCPTFDLSGTGLQIAPRIVTAPPVTMTSSDTVLVVRKTTGSATAITLPTPNGSGQVITIKDGKGDAATNPITITPASGTIDGASSYAISTAYGVWRGFWDGTTWVTL